MKATLSIVFILLSVVCFGQTKLFGLVTDENGEGIPGANVSIKDSYDGASTNVDGKFEFTTTETGIKILVITFVGYKNFEKKINNLKLFFFSFCAILFSNLFYLSLPKYVLYARIFQLS